MSRTSLNPYALIFIAVILFPLYAAAQLQIVQVNSTVSTCANNGTITVNATTTAPPLLYSLISGPFTSPTQTTATFSSLPAGTYMVQVSDGALQTQTQSITVPGNYLQPDFRPVVIHPYCIGSSDGIIIGNRIWNTGNAPFTWQLIAPSPVTTAPQASDTFSQLPAGNYTIRLSDGCGGFRTQVATLTNPQPSNITIYAPPRIKMKGCDSALVTLSMHADVMRFPYTFTFTTNAGSFTTTTPTYIDSTSGCCGYFTVEQILTPFTYGDDVQVTITDYCGNVLTSPTYHSKSFTFCTFPTYHFNNCNYNINISFDLNNLPCDNGSMASTSVQPPLTYVVTDMATNTVADKDTVKGVYDTHGFSYTSGFVTHDLATGKNYSIVIKDSCGNTTTQQFYVPVPVTPQPVINSKSLYPSGCNDSSAFVLISADNFKNQPRLVLLSGPAFIGSSKPGYAYSSPYSYPDTFAISAGGDPYYRFDISNLTVGTYQFKVIDSCGSEVFDSLVIHPADVTHFSHHFTYKKGCLGKNEIHYDISFTSGMMHIRNLSTGAEQIQYYNSQDFDHPIHDSMMNLASGQYEVQFTYQGYFGSGWPANGSTIPCQVITDTITIEGYQTPAIHARNYIQCKTNTYLEIIADSSKGVPPFSYEVINGPQLFPLQNDNVFTTSLPGTYTVRIYDVCGNASAAQFTVSAISFPPVTLLPASCNSTRLTLGASAYYNYYWKAPDGTIYNTDTLTISPVTPADTGTYTIQRITNINGCTDTANTTYHLQAGNRYEQSQSICNGHSITIGSHTYTSAGTYYDTLTGSTGCDSIVILHLSMLPTQRDTLHQNICPGSSYLFNGKTYSVAGTYSDTLPTATCDSIATLVLSANLITKDIYGQICENSFYNFHGKALTQADIYHDTLPTATCDSIVTLHLSVLPIKHSAVQVTLCPEETITFNGQEISAAGTYTDTLPTATCDSIVVLTITTVAPTIQMSATPTTITTGGSVQLQASDAVAWLWTSNKAMIQQPTQASTTAVLDSSGWIYVQALSRPDSCTLTDSVFITVLTQSMYCQDASIYLPSAFTPNKDGLNDVFRIISHKVTIKSFRVYNRWGEQVFYTTDAQCGWDGYYKGNMLPASYVYVVIYTDCMGETKTTYGTVVLIR
ncbi:gliding motility-associated C-terminal domain-containing protein [Filimonas lacunae]|uniref:Gliding motility-associated C-terminal domain-containing protein n=1 Tax=Filimonas lacunae TaxID=477680 RepID=A0A173MIK8_9BACT|nr:gliding motility-associated C-terminal domain-containing protein [Filimonas lacunae]BAV07472.1 CHU large protein [Filimonas lacunae]SIT30245.1 gliding motility-associated C-terminal domain-containing protein [Filimonas lacunae]